MGDRPKPNPSPNGEGMDGCEEGIAEEDDGWDCGMATVPALLPLPLPLLLTLLIWLLLVPVMACRE